MNLWSLKFDFLKIISDLISSNFVDFCSLFQKKADFWKDFKIMESISNVLEFVVWRLD